MRRPTNTPTSTRSYKSRTVMDARDHFDVDRMTYKLEPDEDEWEYMYAAAVSTTAYGTTRGAKSPFPSPVDFVDVFWGYGQEEEPVWQEWKWRERSTLMLRIISRLIEQIEMLEVDRYETVQCPICDEETIEIGIGNGLIWDEELSSVRLDIDSERAVSLELNCTCRGFNPFDFFIIEAQI